MHLTVRLGKCFYVSRSIIAIDLLLTTDKQIDPSRYQLLIHSSLAARETTHNQTEKTTTPFPSIYTTTLPNIYPGTDT